MGITILIVFMILLALGLAGSLYLVYLLNRSLKASIAREEKAYRELLDFPSANPNPVLRVNKMGLLLFANPASVPILLFWNVRINDKIPPQWRELVRQVLDNGKIQKNEYTMNDKTYALSTVPVGKDMVGIYAMDITQKIQLEKTLERKATTDEVTELPNHIIFSQNVGLEMNHARKKSTAFAVMVVRLDDLNEIVSTYGQKIGAQFLRMFAGRLLDTQPNLSTVARISEMVFGVMLPNCTNPTMAETRAEQVFSECTLPYEISGTEIFTTISIGIAFYPGDGTDAQSLMRSAELAVQRTSGTRNQVEFYQKGMIDQLALKRGLIVDLHKALKNQEFELFYQPQIELNSMKMKSAEALIRWHHPEKGYISPYFFMPIAEETQLVVPMGEWVIKNACMQAVSWQKKGVSQFKVGVNLSAQQLFEGDIVQYIENTLNESGARPELIEIELTETVLAKDFDKAIEIMKQFRNKGLEIALDDFGTGYSSLSYLMQFPVNRLKIDRAFVKIIEQNIKQNHDIIRGMIDLAHNLGLKVVAEGVETPGQLKFLKNAGCDIIQGYFFSEPVPVQQFERLFAKKWG